jgi:uncharacterized protein YidB (DUF937 family)
MASPPSVFDALAAGNAGDDPLDQRLLADFAERLATRQDANPLARLLDDFTLAGFAPDVRAWLAPGQSSAPPALPADAIERVATVGHVLDHPWLAATASRNGIEVAVASRRLGALVPRVVKALTPRGEVPTARALAIGLDALRRRAPR